MLNVNFVDEEDRKVSGGLWIDFVNGFRLTAPEVVDAYYRALRKQLLNSKGEEIKIYPNLSLITAGEILNAFLEFKMKSPAYEKGRKELTKLLSPKTEHKETPEERRKRVEETILEIKEHLEAGEKYDGAFVIYKDLKADGVLDEFIPSKDKILKLQQKGMKRLLNREKAKRFLFDMGTFKKYIELNKKGEDLPVHPIINLDIKTEIVSNYVRNKFSI